MKPFDMKDQNPLKEYVQVKDHVPILALVHSDADLRSAFRLSRTSINILIQLLPRNKKHGWTHEMEVLVTIYCLACGASYRVTADTFAVPMSTVCRIVHNVMKSSLKTFLFDRAYSQG
ncbi:hypothetical protein EYF80_059712 [Liparis tanakae]|uniref:Nuclease HARBI1 n=1 Tax=Liparis tanakae TaxID=230148 RepID=A0A4Z2EMG8_9TELE|nr:hypothetical protein EYF80_059712 [Liparis tanakae]